jgi:hypothetical protein
VPVPVVRHLQSNNLFFLSFFERADFSMVYE